MNINKVIVSSDNEIRDLIIKRFDLKKEDKSDFIVYKWVKKNDWFEENILLFDIKNDADVLDFIFDNFEIEKIINIWTAKTIENSDYKQWDVIIPNTFIWKDKESPIFSEYAIWESYDLNKFWLILSWLCVTIDNEKINNKMWDAIFENEAYDILDIAKKKNVLDKCVVIKEINNDNEFVWNCVDVLELVL